MKADERAAVMVALCAVELNMSECKVVAGWWDSLSAENRHEWLEFQAKVRRYQREVQNPAVFEPYRPCPN